MGKVRCFLPRQSNPQPKEVALVVFLCLPPTPFKIQTTWGR